ncbi:ABC transporter ATP-binding protein [Rhodobacteraceae bacterium]|nr:ABC transporter ATP-binding protein [Paracoccaceae bacterium]
MPSVSFEHIVKRFGAVTVLDGLNLTVEKGDFLVLLGPSGCGKTTLLNLLAGLLDVSSGRIMIGDRDVTELDPKDRGLAMVFQSYALYPTKTVEGNLRFGLSARKLPKAEADARVTWASELLQLTPLMRRKPSELSGGQRQRVAIGRALVKHADVLLFDEPLSNLDAKLRTEMRLEIKKLHDTLSPTVVYVTHDQIEAMTMATKIAIMNGGEIQQFGTPDEVYENPANLFVASFIGSPAMNLTNARFRITDGSPGAMFDNGTKMDLTGYDFVSTPQDGDAIAVGMRPEHFLIDTQGTQQSHSAFDLTVKMVERTGSDALISLEFADDQLFVRAEPDRAAKTRPGETVSVQYPTAKLNLFDAREGRRL